MRPLKLTIPGRYYDSQIYSGRLFLFEVGGSIKTIDWDRLVHRLGVRSELRVAAVAGFQRSDFLYGQELSALFSDHDLRLLISDKFRELSAVDLEASTAALQACTVSQQDNQFPFPHSDTELYANRLYVGGGSGIWSAGCNRRTKYGVSTRIERVFDGPVLGIAASYMTLAAAAGSDGLLELDIASHVNSVAVRRTSESLCEDCHWLFHSIYATSRSGGYLAEYSRPRWMDREEGGQFSDTDRREFMGLVPGADLFGKEGYGWGSADKLCLASNGSIDVVRHSPRQVSARRTAEIAGTLKAVAPVNEIVAAALAPFGIVVEYSSQLAVYGSDGSREVMEGEPVNWRLFPRSKHYENHLHVVHEDRLDIVSFNHDYLIDQQEKLAGTAVRVSKTRSGTRLVELMKWQDQESEE